MRVSMHAHGVGGGRTGFQRDSDRGAEGSGAEGRGQRDRGTAGRETDTETGERDIGRGIPAETARL